MQKYLQKQSKKYRSIKNRFFHSEQAFALPALIVISTTLMIVSAAVLQGTLAVKSSLDNQYYNQLAKEAAEAGVAYANACIAKGANITDNTLPLRPTTDCDGVSQRTTGYVVDSSQVKTEFQTDGTDIRIDGSLNIQSSGTVIRYKRSGELYKTYTQDIQQFTGVQLERLKTRKTVTSGYTTFIIASDNTVYAMGQNTYGQLGLGDTASRTTPTKMTLRDPSNNEITVRDVIAGSISTYFIGSDNYLYATGSNSDGQMGIGNTTQQLTPVRVNLKDPSNNVLTTKSVTTDGYSTYLIASDDYAYVMGSNGYGVLGIGGTADQLTPVRMNLKNPSNVAITAKSVITNGFSAYVIGADDYVYVMGGNAYGQLGVGDTANKMTPVRMNLKNPSNVAITAREVYTGENNQQAFVLGSDNFVYSMGYNADGELGVNSTSSVITPARMQLKNPSNVAITAVSVTSGNATYITGSDGYLYATGKNGSGELGNGTTTRSLVPVRVNLKDAANVLLKPTKVVSFSSAAYAIASDGYAYAWGDNTYGRLGNGNSTNQLNPVKLQPAGASGNNMMRDIAMMDFTVYMVTTSYNTYAAGDNYYGQIGNGTTLDQFTPQLPLLPRLPKTDIVMKAYTSAFTTLSIATDGFVYASGANNGGQLGIGTSQSRASAPLKMQLKDSSDNYLFGQDITCAGLAFSCYVIASDGYAYAMGSNAVGQLGIGNNVNKNLPTRMILKDASNNDVRPLSIATNAYAETDTTPVYILGADGTVFVTGRNDYGQLGIGNTTNQSTPARMNLRDPSNNVLTAKKVVTSGTSAYILASDDFVYAVGLNNYGQLGIGNTTNQSTPVRMNVKNASNVALTAVDILADNYAAFVIASDRQIYGTGQNNGALGNGLVPDVSTPVLMTLKDPSNNVLTARSMATDGFSAFIIASDNFLYSTGYNNLGQLGIGSTAQRFTPIRMNLKNPGNVAITTQKVASAGIGGDTFAIGSDNYVYSVGWNQYGQIGVNSTTNTTTPQRVQLKNSAGVSLTAKDVIVDHAATLFIGSDDRAYMTGLNDNGQLGAGDYVNKLVPGVFKVPTTTPQGTKVVF